MPDTHTAMRARDDRDGYGKAPMSRDATCQRPYPPVATLCAMFDHAVATAPDKVALRHLDVVLTYREMGRDRLPALAGGVTFYILLATVPALAARASPTPPTAAASASIPSLPFSNSSRYRLMRNRQ